MTTPADNPAPEPAEAATTPAAPAAPPDAVTAATGLTGALRALETRLAEAVAYGTATFEVEPPPEAEMARRQEALLANNYPYVVAVQDGVVAGYAYAGPYHARPAYRWSVEDSVYVAPEFQRQGFGRLSVLPGPRRFNQRASSGEEARH